MRSSNWPERPTNGRPCRSSSAPGASPTSISREPGVPSANTSRLAELFSAQPSKRSRMARKLVEACGAARGFARGHRRRHPAGRGWRPLASAALAGGLRAASGVRLSGAELRLAARSEGAGRSSDSQSFGVSPTRDVDARFGVEGEQRRGWLCCGPGSCGRTAGKDNRGFAGGSGSRTMMPPASVPSRRADDGHQKRPKSIRDPLRLDRFGVHVRWRC